MSLLQVLGVGSAADIDPDRALAVGAVTIGPEAVREAIALLSTAAPRTAIKVVQAPVMHGPFYWSLARNGASGEIIGLPTLTGSPVVLPTAIELGIVRALHSADPQDHPLILSGNCQIVLGAEGLCGKFYSIVSNAAPPLAGDSVLWNNHTQAVFSDTDDARITTTIIECFRNSFVASPLKFRVLELYRVMESLFLEEIRQKLLRDFSTSPGTAVAAAEKSLKSEIEQFVALVERYKEPFEYIWLALADIKDNNKFSAAIFQKLKASSYSSPEWKAGAALLYYIRCAIVHAGNKDIIFDSYADGQEALTAIMPFVETGALGLAGIATA